MELYYDKRYLSTKSIPLYPGNICYNQIRRTPKLWKSLMKLNYYRIDRFFSISCIRPVIICQSTTTTRSAYFQSSYTFIDSLFVLQAFFCVSIVLFRQRFKILTFHERTQFVHRWYSFCNVSKICKESCRNFVDSNNGIILSLQVLPNLSCTFVFREQQELVFILFLQFGFFSCRQLLFDTFRIDNYQSIYYISSILLCFWMSFVLERTDMRFGASIICSTETVIYNTHKCKIANSIIAFLALTLPYLKLTVAPASCNFAFDRVSFIWFNIFFDDSRCFFY